jgi:hypothetical protein
VWGLYAAYTWTTYPFFNTLQVVRFYVPAIGAISLLAAWLVVRLPRRVPLAAVARAAVASAAVVVVLFGLGVWSFSIMRTTPLPGQVRLPAATASRPAGPPRAPLRQVPPAGN